MRIASVRIQNLRAFCDETIPFDNYTCFVGPNGAGKSTVFTALNIFFRHDMGFVIDQDDFHKKDTSKAITITVTFEELSDAAQKDLSAYFRQGKLVVSTVVSWNSANNQVEIKQYGQRLAMGAFKEFFRRNGDGAQVAELKKIYVGIREAVPDLAEAGTKTAMIEALQAYETAHPEKCELIPSEDQFYGVSRGTNRLAKYMEWVYVPAVKDVCLEQAEGKGSAFGLLLQRTVRTSVSFAESIAKMKTGIQADFVKLVAERQEALAGLSQSLNKRLQEWAHPNSSIELEWHGNPDDAIRITEPTARLKTTEGTFQGKLSCFGHGLQRSYLLALLQELSESRNEDGPRLILACEEPELYQHPPQARHMANVFQKLSSGNSQVLICTHSPYFVAGKDFEQVRMIRKAPSDDAACAFFVRPPELAAELKKAYGGELPALDGLFLKVHQVLKPNINEMFFCNIAVFVEGVEDSAYISTYLSLMEKWTEFRRLGCHIITCDKKSEIIRPLAVARSVKIPSFVVFDSDGNGDPTKPSHEMHKRDNLAILRLCDIADPNPFPPTTFWGPNVVSWDTELTKVIKDDIGTELGQLKQDVANRFHVVAGDHEKNAAFIGMLMTEAWNKNKKSANLEKVCNAILTFASSQIRKAG